MVSSLISNPLSSQFDLLSLRTSSSVQVGVRAACMEVKNRNMAIRVSMQSCVVIPQAQVVNVREGRRGCWIVVWTPEGLLVTAADTRPKTRYR
jgi:hypothetical protein